ncbi:hypothetical protein RFI_01372, partial [Reticulomyxa filosa]
RKKEKEKKEVLKQESMAKETDEKTQTNEVPSVTQWSCEMVKAWISSVDSGKFTQYADTFARNEITGDLLVSLTLKDLDQGLYIHNLRQRMDLHNLICALKDTPQTGTTAKPFPKPPSFPSQEVSTTTAGNFAPKPSLARSFELYTEAVVLPKDITELPKARKLRNKRKRKGPESNATTSVTATTTIPTPNSRLSNDPNTNRPLINSNNNNNNMQSTMLYIQRAINENKSASQLLVEKTPVVNTNDDSNKGNGAKKTEEEIGETIDIDWCFRDQAMEPLDINVNDQIHFQWKYTRNIWLFKNQTAYLNNDFAQGEQLTGCDKYSYLWKAIKPGVFYFGCQIGNCAKAGHMKLVAHVHDSDHSGNVVKRRKLQHIQN